MGAVPDSSWCRSNCMLAAKRQHMPAALRCSTITRDIVQVLLTLVNNELLVKLCKQMATWRQMEENNWSPQSESLNLLEYMTWHDWTKHFISFARFHFSISLYAVSKKACFVGQLWMVFNCFLNKINEMYPNSTNYLTEFNLDPFFTHHRPPLKQSTAQTHNPNLTCKVKKGMVLL